MAYSDFMGKIKASNMFAGIIAIPLGKIKSKAVILVLASELALLIHWVVPVSYTHLASADSSRGGKGAASDSSERHNFSARQ